MITVDVVLFGHFKDIFPKGKTALPVSPGATANEVATTLAQSDSRLINLLGKTRVAINGEFADTQQLLHDGDEVAFLPPMSGG